MGSLLMPGGGGRTTRKPPTSNWSLGGGGTGNSRSLQITRQPAGPTGTTAGPTGYAAGPTGSTAGPRAGGSAGPMASGGFGTSSYGRPQYSSGSSLPMLPQRTPVTVTPPKPAGTSQISVSAERNPQLDALLKEQQQNISNLKNNTGFAADVAATRTADAFEGAKNAAKYLGGGGSAGAGMRGTRQNQLTDAQLRAQAGQQADLALGREGMVTGAIQNQLPTILGQQSGMLQQQGLGLNAEQLRQQQQNNQFNQQLQGQQFATGVEFQNQNLANQQALQQLQALQGVQGLYNSGWGY